MKYSEQIALNNKSKQSVEANTIWRMELQIIPVGKIKKNGFQ